MSSFYEIRPPDLYALFYVIFTHFWIFSNLYNIEKNSQYANDDIKPSPTHGTILLKKKPQADHRLTHSTVAPESTYSVIIKSKDKNSMITFRLDLHNSTTLCKEYLLKEYYQFMCSLLQWPCWRQPPPETRLPTVAAAPRTAVQKSMTLVKHGSIALM